MTGLQEAFYIMAIVYMGITLLFGLIGLGAVLVIRKKIGHLQQSIEDRFRTAKDLAYKGEAVVDTIKKVTRKRRK